MEQWRGKVAIVTGASSGIGAATARALASRGLIVVGMDIQFDKLKKLAEEVTVKGPGKMFALKVDMRKEEELRESFAWVDKELGSADILFNNAGLALTGHISDSKVEDWRTMLDVNVLAVLICTQLFLKSLEKRNTQTGHIIIMDSITGHISPPGQFMGVYAATKYAIKALSMSLRVELANKNSAIKVTTISPGAVETNIWQGTQHAQDLPNKIKMLKSEDIAETVLHVLSTPPSCQVCDIVLNPVPTSKNHFLY